jgi:hypothetical protein
MAYLARNKVKPQLEEQEEEKAVRSYQRLGKAMARDALEEDDVDEIEKQYKHTKAARAHLKSVMPGGSKYTGITTNTGVEQFGVIIGQFHPHLMTCKYLGINYLTKFLGKGAAVSRIVTSLINLNSWDMSS